MLRESDIFDREPTMPAMMRLARWAITGPCARRWFGTSCTRHENKVAALDFQLGTQDAVYRARLAALEQLLPTIKGRWGGVGFALSQAFGLGWMTESEESVMRFVSSRAVYYPTWVVDAMFRVPCRGENGTAIASFITTNSTFPGNAWKPMNTLPFRAPPPRTSSTPPPTNSVITPSDEPMEYAPFSRSRHLNPNVEVSDSISVLPFDISPMSLTALCKSADLRSSMIDMLSEGPALHINKRFTILPGVEIQVANIDTSKRDEEKRAMLRMDWDKLEVEMLACYPVMLPIHLVEFHYDAHGEQNCQATVALGAWDSRTYYALTYMFSGLITYGLRCEEKDAWMYKGDMTWLDIDMLDFEPRVPISRSTLDPNAKDDNNEVTDARIVDLMAQQSQMQAVFEHRAKSCVDETDWAACKEWERKHASSPNSTEATSGVGEHVAWDSPHVRPYYGESIERIRQYVALSTEAAFSSRLLDGIEADRRNGTDLSHVQTLHEGELVSGDRAIAVLKDRLAKIQARRLESKPDWLT